MALFCLLITLVLAPRACHAGPILAPPRTIQEALKGKALLTKMLQILNTWDLPAKPQPAMTVFMPEDKAWDAYCKTLGMPFSELLQRRDLMAQILFMHIYPGRLPKSAIPVGTKTVTMVNTQTLQLTRSSTGVVQVRDPIKALTTFIAFDIRMPTDVVAHVIRKVLVPRFIPPTVLNLIWASGLDLSDRPCTIFAPTDKAFQSSTPAIARAAQTLFNADFAINRASLNVLLPVLRFHIIDDKALRASSLKVGMKLETMVGASQLLSVESQWGISLVASPTSRAKIIQPDIAFMTTCVVHIVDKVLLPRSLG